MHNILLNSLLPHDAVLEGLNHKYNLLPILFSFICVANNFESRVISLRSLGLLAMSRQNKSIFDILGSVQMSNMLFRPLYIAVVDIGYLDLKFLRLFTDKDLLLLRRFAFYLNYLEVAQTNVEINNLITHWHVLLLFCLGVMQIIILFTLCPQNLRTLTSYQGENIIRAITLSAILYKPLLLQHIINPW